MKNENMVRNSRENKRVSVIYSDNEVSLRRLALMYQDFVCGTGVKKCHYATGNSGPAFELYLRMAPYKRNDMAAACGLRRGKPDGNRICTVWFLD